MSLIVKDISFQYSSRKEFVFDKVNFSIPKGKVYALMGSSGSGKSTMLKVITGFYKPLTGSIQVNNTFISMKETYKNFGYVSQSAIEMLLPWYKVSENINLPISLRNSESSENKNHRTDLINALELTDKLNDYPYELSGGEQKRLSLAVALCYKPDVILFDEPFSGIDIKLANSLQLFLLTYFKKENPTVLFVTHSLEEAALLADKTLLMTKNKEVICCDKSRDDFFDCNLDNFESLLSSEKFSSYKEYLRQKLNDYFA